MGKCIKVFVVIVLVSATVYLFKLNRDNDSQVVDTQNMAVQVVQFLSMQEWKALAEIVHPTEGMYLSKFTYIPVGVYPEENQGREEATLMPNEIAQIHHSKKMKKWTICEVCDGEDVYEELTVEQFLNTHIYDRPFGRVRPGPRNEVIQRSQIMMNIEEAFQGEIAFYEFHIPDKSNEQGGWGSLRVILKKEGVRWYLVGLVHDGLSI